jgi:2-polyprenyl-3-methyl-5-hydroxy-6-metoxy-1,4-benzoquinol methylase
MKCLYANWIDFKRIFFPAEQAGQYDLNYAKKAESHYFSEIVGKEIKLIIDNLPHIPKNILDVGCNTGLPLAHLCEVFHAQGMGIDINTDALVMAKRNYRSKKFKVYNGIDIPADDEQFDHVTLHHVLAHVEDPERVLEEIYRVLKPNGTLSIVTSNAYYKLLQFPLNIMRGFHPDTTILRHFTQRSLLQLLHNSGFEMVFFSTFGPTPSWFPISKFRLRLIYIVRKL